MFAVTPTTKNLINCSIYKIYKTTIGVVDVINLGLDRDRDLDIIDEGIIREVDHGQCRMIDIRIMISKVIENDRFRDQAQDRLQIIIRHRMVYRDNLR